MNDEFYECSDDWEVFTDDSYDNFPQDDVYYEQPPYQPPPVDPFTQPGLLELGFICCNAALISETDP